MKKFHGSSVPRPRMKKQIPTKQPLWVGKKKKVTFDKVVQETEGSCCATTNSQLFPFFKKKNTNY